jgi:large conductance mechanosensitive channel
MLKGFRDFILRGNVVDLAVAVVIGAAFGAIVNSLVSDLINPAIAAIAQKPDFSYLVLTVHSHGCEVTKDPKATNACAQIKYGNFLNSAISFLLIAASIYFFVVFPLGKLLARFKPVPAVPPAMKPCPECLSDIPVAAKRCSHCGQPVPPVEPVSA